MGRGSYGKERTGMLVGLVSTDIVESTMGFNPFLQYAIRKFCKVLIAMETRYI